MTVIYSLLVVIYIIIGVYVCKQYIDMNPIKIKKMKKTDMIERIIKRTSIILFYPIYGIVISIGLLIELLTEDEPFK